jgi:hypothetical protein
LDVIGKATLAAILAVAACYLAVGGYYGYLVGRTMYEAKASNPMIAMVAGAVGRNNAEQFAIVKMRVPPFIVKAPTFLLLLRMNE